MSVHACIHTCMCVHACMHVYIHACVFMHACMCTYMHVCTYMNVCSCMNVWTCNYRWLRFLLSANVEDGNQPSNDGLAYIGTGVIEAVSEGAVKEGLVSEGVVADDMVSADVIADEMGEGKTMGNEGVVTDKTEGDSSSEDELQQRSLFDEMTQIESEFLFLLCIGDC